METKRNVRKWPLILGIVIVVLLAAAIGCQIWFQHTHLMLHDEPCRRDAVELDLSGIQNPELEKLPELAGLQLLNLRDTGITIEQYEALRAALPECHILWSIPFQGGYLPDDTTSITISSLTEADISLLKTYLPDLESVDALQCRDFDALLAMRMAFPRAEIAYTLPINGQEWPLDTDRMTLRDLEVQELEAMLPHMGRVAEITLEGTLPQPEDLYRLTDAYPNIRFYWQVELFGLTADVDTTELDLSNIPMESTDELETAVAYLPNLQRVLMHGCGIRDEEMEALNLRHEDVLFVWTVKIGHMSFSTDVTTFMPLQLRMPLTDRNSHNLRYLTELVVLDLGHQEITNIDFVVNMKKLKYFIFADTDVGDITPLTGLDQLIYLEFFDTPVTDYTPLLTLTGLENLNLSYTYGDYEIIAQMTWLDYVRWVQNYVLQITDGQKDYLRGKLPDTLLELGAHTSATAGEWRRTQNYYDMRDLLGMFYMYG